MPGSFEVGDAAEPQGVTPGAQIERCERLGGDDGDGTCVPARTPVWKSLITATRRYWRLSTRKKALVVFMGRRAFVALEAAVTACQVVFVDRAAFVSTT